MKNNCKMITILQKLIIAYNISYMSFYTIQLKLQYDKKIMS